MSSLADRIREAAEEVGGLDRLAELGGFPRRSLGNWLKGTRPKPEILARIAEVAGVQITWLVSEQGGKFDRTFSELAEIEQRIADADRARGDHFDRAFSRGLARLADAESDHLGGPALARPLPDLVQLPRYDVRASAGRGALVVSEDVADYFAVGRAWLRRNLPSWAPSNAVVGILEGAGDSMEPTIRDGDLIMVVQGVEWRVVERGGIFVLSLDGERFLLKRLQVLMNGDLKIISDNKVYDPEIVPYDDIRHRVIVHGQVFFTGGKPRSL